MALDLSNNAPLQDAWKTLTEKDTEQNWLLGEIDGTTVSLSGTGTGGLAEVTSKLDASKVQFGAFRVVGVDNRETTVSRRPKFIWFIYIGSGVSVLKKARVSVQKPDIAKFFASASYNIEVASPSVELSRNFVGKKLLDAGGAHKPTHYEFAPGDTLPIADITN